ncbi:carbon monoxide dehydrogenase [Acidihalobacter aeolianus]|uniref:Carbon monoxide dehydrogenase n=1 Tax=Acidihalobacter aeolianus TaxID=2792603 RepID=A0A1D8K5U0_9GAMM|nr:xanthine dehydrogenase family protein molybdopterin-binding subunit [Acidihalobacter aeolianus]AOV16326.1 carbon monoxide dehydrogenase [Acidihalobacter aeolianus]
MKQQGIGARLLRKEDDRYLRGRGEFIADIVLPGQCEVAFLRSPLAHARIRGIHVPEAIAAQTFTAADLADVLAIRAVSKLPGFRVSEQPVLAADKVRHVGEPLALCFAEDRAAAEDAVGLVDVDFEELPAVHDMLQAREPDSPLLHENWDRNVFLETFVDGDIETPAAHAAASVTREYRTARQCMAPIEGRGVVAYWDSRKNLLTVYTSTQMPHVVRSGLSECLGLEEDAIRVIAPDVGGGFGYKGILLAEEVCLAWLTLRLGRPVRWIEDRREHLIGNADCREHHYRITAHADANGKLLALDAEVTVDSGAYSAYPFSACLEAAQVASILPGPYDFSGYRCRTFSAATNKCAILPYRGVARTGVCYAMELTLDALARELGLEPWQVRMANLVPPEKMPFDNITRKHFDSGDYPECMRRAVQAIDLDAWRERQRTPEPDGRLIGVGFSIYCEQSAHGTSVYSGWGIPMIPGYEEAFVRVTPNGGLDIRVGVQSHGQSMETTFAQLAHEILGVDTDRVRVMHGDTADTAYSTGTWGSRSMVMAGGAVATACDALAARLRTVAASMLGVEPEGIVLADGEARSQGGSLSLRELAYLWYRRPQDLPRGLGVTSLETNAAYKPVHDHGVFSYAAHAVAVAVDPELGTVELLDYAIVEDGGVLVNPMVVDGQIIGGTAQGIGTALYEEMAFDSAGQPLASTFSDYLLPGACEMPDIRIEHMETPSPYTRFGVKGVGEGGAIAPPAAIGNAVNDALRFVGAEITETPMTPRRILAAITRATQPDTETGT